jgi:hypothetical protein
MANHILSQKKKDYHNSIAEADIGQYPVQLYGALG